MQHSETDSDGRREKPHTYTHTHSPSSLSPSHTHTLTHTRARAHAAALSLAGNNPTLTWGLSCTGGMELLPCTSVSSKCRSCRRVVCVSVGVCACVRLFLPENAEAFSPAGGDPRGPGGSPGSPHPGKQAHSLPACTRRGLVLDLASVAWFGLLEPCSPGQLEPLGVLICHREEGWPNSLDPTGVVVSVGLLYGCPSRTSGVLLSL